MERVNITPTALDVPKPKPGFRYSWASTRDNNPGSYHMYKQRGWKVVTAKEGEAIGFSEGYINVDTGAAKAGLNKNDGCVMLGDSILMALPEEAYIDQHKQRRERAEGIRGNVKAKAASEGVTVEERAK